MIVQKLTIPLNFSHLSLVILELHRANFSYINFILLESQVLPRLSKF